MASISATSLLLLFFLSFYFPLLLFPASSLGHSASVLQDLNNLKPPPDFNTTIVTNCLGNPSLRYCNSSSSDLPDIFKFTIVAAHLCNESNNRNCFESFDRIDLGTRPKIAPLYLSFNFFWRYCPLTILSIDLKNNSLKGNFPSDILQCTQIQALDLSQNELSGDFPIQAFSPLKNLTFLNLSFNRFSESEITESRFFKRFNSSSFLHSGLLPNRRRFRVMAALLLIGFPVFVVLMVCLFGWLCFRRPDYLPAMFRPKHKFTLAILEAATNGFSRKNLVGTCEEIELYKGILRGSREVRIEIYRDNISSENRQEFVEECEVLVQLRNKNLVRVLGWCDNRRVRAIVTEWTNGENVDTWLSESAPPWNQRAKVLVGVIQGMCYLHDQWPAVGYDLRTSSVLLSDDLEPLISRFKVGDRSSSTRRIYQFGLFVLEVITNRRAREEFRKGETGFIEWVRMHYPGDVSKIVDQRMDSKNTIDQTIRCLGIGLMCTDLSSGQQPRSDRIYSMLARVCDLH